MPRSLRLEILAQPDNNSCGPTSLHAVYRYFGDDVTLNDIIAETRMLPEGGTLGVTLASHALRRGYEARIYTYNLNIFDPTWFHGHGQQATIAAKLHEQLRHKHDVKLAHATEAYLEFLELGGELRFRELSPRLIRDYLRKHQPILTGLSATYLYNCSREDPKTEEYDDVAGSPVGHFVVLADYDDEHRKVLVADPLADNPTFGDHIYEVSIERLLGAILLGALTYDAVLVIIHPKDAKKR